MFGIAPGRYPLDLERSHMKSHEPRWPRMTWGAAVIGLAFMAVGHLQSETMTGAGIRSVDAGQVRAVALSVDAGQAADLVASPTPELSPSEWAGIREAYDRHRRQAVPVAGHDDIWQASNPGQQWVTRFDRRGFLVEPADGGWTWGLELTRYGIQGDETAVTAAPDVRVDGARVTYARGGGVDEWFVNDGRGLEHGFTLRERPAVGIGPLALEFGVRGGLQPRIDADRHGVTFIDTAQTPVVTYAGLTVIDADERAVRAWFEPAAAGLRLVVQDTGARYPVTIDPIAQQAYLKASNTDAGDLFGGFNRMVIRAGLGVAASGDTVVVGASGEDSAATGVNGNQGDDSVTSAGAAYVFVRSGGGWSQQAYLKASNTDAGDRFGWSVAVSGDTVVVGAQSEHSAATGVNGNQADNSADGAGAAYVFVRSGGTWSQQAYLKASNTDENDAFGGSVAVSGDTIVVGASSEDSSATGVNGNQSDDSVRSAGAAYVFVRSGGAWSQQAYLKASNTDEVDEVFGNSVAVSGDTVIVGAWQERSAATGVNGNQSDNSAFGAGAAYVFVRSGGAWDQQAYLKASNTDARDVFGWSVAVSGDTVVVGARHEDSVATGVNGDQGENSADGAGAAYVFVRSGGAWSQQAYLKASNTDALDWFGGSVAVSGDTIVVGAHREDSKPTGVNADQSDNSAFNAGAAYVFTRSGADWSQQAYLKAADAGAGDFFGGSVAVSGNTAVVGAPHEDSVATGVNGDESDDSASRAGAAYVFELEPPNQPPIADAGLDQPAVECTGVVGTGCVTVTLDGTGSSDPDGDALTYTWEPGTLGGPVAFPILPLGTHEFTLEVNDGNGGTDTDAVTVTVVDTMPPLLEIDAAVDADGMAVSDDGATLADALTVSFTASDESGVAVTCALDGGLPMSCGNPLEVTGLPVGAHLVELVATDAAGNTTVATFAWNVVTPAQAIESVVDVVEGLVDAGSVNGGQGNALISKLDAALDKVNQGQSTPAINQLNAMLNQVAAFVQSGVLTAAEGQALTEAVTAIIAAI
jgi:hypothetical protein